RRDDQGRLVAGRRGERAIDRWVVQREGGAATRRRELDRLRAGDVRLVHLVRRRASQDLLRAGRQVQEDDAPERIRRSRDEYGPLAADRDRVEVGPGLVDELDVVWLRSDQVQPVAPVT